MNQLSIRPRSRRGFSAGRQRPRQVVRHVQRLRSQPAEVPARQMLDTLRRDTQRPAQRHSAGGRRRREAIAGRQALLADAIDVALAEAVVVECGLHGGLDQLRNRVHRKLLGQDRAHRAAEVAQAEIVATECQLGAALHHAAQRADLEGLRDVDELVRARQLRDPERIPGPVRQLLVVVIVLHAQVQQGRGHRHRPVTAAKRAGSAHGPACTCPAAAH